MYFICCVVFIQIVAIGRCKICFVIYADTLPVYYTLSTLIVVSTN